MSREAEILLAIDEFAAALAAVSKLVELIPPAAVNGAGAEDADDQADALIDTTSAAARFGLARDTIAKACREIPGVGTWRGGRWQVRVGTLGFGEPTAGEETRVRGASRAVLD